MIALLKTRTMKKTFIDYKTETVEDNLDTTLFIFFKLKCAGTTTTDELFLLSQVIM